jgi:hypothetical protein
MRGKEGDLVDLYNIPYETPPKKYKKLCIEIRKELE